MKFPCEWSWKQMVEILESFVNSCVDYAYPGCKWIGGEIRPSGGFEIADWEYRGVFFSDDFWRRP